MLAWAAELRKASSIYDGTIGSLAHWYFNSDPYRELKPNTQLDYKRHLKPLLDGKSAKLIEDITGADVVRWFKELQEGRSRTTAYTMISVFKAVVSFGAAEGKEECAKLRGMLTAARFKKGERRQSCLTREQVQAFNAAAIEYGRPSMALGLTLQFELGMRQRDVIGEWVRATGADGIRDHENRRWGNGLTGMLFDNNGHMVKRTTKTGSKIEHSIDDHPELAAMVRPILERNRGGPLVINEATGVPYKAAKYREFFRRIARKAGIPDDVWSMDARAGAITEALESGATIEDTRAFVGHTDAKTTRTYNRSVRQQSSRVARRRLERRNE